MSRFRLTNLLCSLRSLLGCLAFGLLTLSFSLLMIVETFVLGNRQFEDKVVELWGRLALWFFGVELQIHGRQNIPTGSCLFLFNHTSFFDVLAMFAAYPSCRFGAKIELFSIPFFGTAMRKIGILPIARQNREEVFKVYQDAKERVLRGEKFALSPEGARNKVEKLLPFKAGPFIFAINAQMPIVPVVIRGAVDVMGKNQILPNDDKWNRTIRIDYLAVISVENVTLEQRTELQDQVRSVMNPYFN